MKLRPLPLALLLNLLLLIGIATSWLRGQTVWTAPAPVVPAATSLKSHQFPAATAQPAALAVIVERPLFAVNRRPPPAAPVLAVADSAEAAEPVDPLSDLRVLGMIGAAATGVIIVSRSGKLERIPVGGKIGGWTLESIDGRVARIVRGDDGGEKRALTVQRAGLRAATPRTAPASAAVVPAPDAPPAASQVASPPAASTPSGSPSVAERVAERQARREALRAQ